MISTIISSNEAGQRFDKYLKKLLKDAPDSFIYKMLRKKNIVLNGKKADGREMLCTDDEVKLFLADETFEKFAGKSDSNNIDITQYKQAYKELAYVDIVYEDNDILVVNKPAGVLSQKSKHEDISINEWLTGYLLFYKKLTADSLSTFRPSICNRLDRNTSGMIVCGKTLAGSQYLSGIIKDKSLEKYYYCLVPGEVSVNERITGWLYKDKTSNKVTVFPDKADIPYSLKESAGYINTAFKTVKTVHNVTLLQVQLFTGKTHQIRAHLSSLGHPIIGDVKYGNPHINKTYAKKGVRSQMLHSYRLVFPDAADHAFERTSGMVLECPVPEVFKRILEEG